MAKWKELGEVPDSDDESLLDSEESQPELPHVPDVQANDPANEETAEVKIRALWDVPFSSEHSDDQSDPDIHSNDRANGGLAGGNKAVWDVPFSSQHPEEHTEPQGLPRNSSTESPTTSKSTQRDLESSLPSSVPHASEEAQNALGSNVRAGIHGPNRGDIAISRESSPERFESRIFVPIDDLEEDEALTRQDSIRLGRSLRPRKPIQEHPYLLESAQYSKLFKSHGVRPVRLPVEETKQRQGEEDSQEQDYEEESQVTAGGAQEEATEESQESRRQEFFETERDELAISSPIRPSPSPRRVYAPSQDIPSSSQNDEDLPSLKDLFKKRARGRPRTYARRKGSPKLSSKRKLHQPVHVPEPSSPPVHPVDVFEIPPSPPQTSPAFFSTTPIATLVAIKPQITSLTPKPSSANASRDPTPAPVNKNFATIDLTTIADLDSSDGEVDTTAISESGSRDGSRTASSSPERAPDISFRQRIRGVLPASYLRLDQQITRDKTRKPVSRRSPEHSPERSHRKGVAQRRQASPKTNNASAFFFSDDSDDEDTILRSNDIENAIGTTDFSIFEDDAGSVVEDDHIDHMLSARKRTSPNLHGPPRPAKRRKTQETFKGQPGERKRQQRITGLLSRSKSGQGTSVARIRPVGSTIGTKASSARQERTVPRQATTPRLSILDVVEPNAPSFIRIAARAASRRPDKGRSSPSRKYISLGTRQDNLDALSVLRNWSKGKIQSRLPSTAPAAHRTTNHQPLQPVSDNPFLKEFHDKLISKGPATIPVNRFSRSRKLAKQTNLNNFVINEPIEVESTTTSLPDDVVLPAPEPITRLLLRRSRTHSAPSRPAQLETAGHEVVNGQAFHARKKVLDAIYRKSRKALPAAPDTRLEQAFRARTPTSQPPAIVDEASMCTPKVIDKKRTKHGPRLRKLLRPRQVDTAAPQYAHANDPLPEEHGPVSEPVTVVEGDSKLIGLGPFGTHYTQHFEIFPLDPGVFFHESTLIGEGRVTKAFDKASNALNDPRGHCILALDGSILRWGEWDAQTSSELGVLFDWILDKLQAVSGTIDVGSSTTLTTVQAADFIVRYLEDYISFSDSDSGRLFINRVLEVLSGFLERLQPLMTRQETSLQQHNEVLTRCVLVVLQASRICGSLGLTESLQLEELLKKTSKQTVQGLLQNDLVDVRSLYGGLQNSSSRERGIQKKQYSIVGWVVLIRVLQECRIPRTGFWDVVSSIMLSNDTASINDTQKMEQMWQNLFTLLPLGEFDNAGIAITGLRHMIPLEGWTLPQRLLSRVFELYKTNRRQPPSFNDYCRALISRCHYLVEQWGWRKCSGIIGTIFDFFASQNLSHLRNEEVYKSPQFLEDLAASPSLAVQPEDRCFHIFLKLLALSVKRLRKFGLIKDVRNLLPRVLPNHDRQYLKESDIHENELAALRNHHDLLCTLFWCYPRDLRPSVQTLEKLVTPGTSHKEACLINLRAWNQLARFVVSSGEDRTVYKPFVDWQNNVFKQVLDQYSSAESDIQQQFLRLAKASTNSVSPELMRRVVNMNKQTATDVLHFSLKANLDVMRHASTLGTASFVLNTYQLHEVFTRFSFSPPDFDWGTLRVAVDTIDHYLGRIERFLEEQVRSSKPADSWHGDDAIMVLDRHVSATFFSMARNLLSNPVNDSLPNPTSERALCLEQTVIIAGRLTALFLHAGVTRLPSFFTPGKYGLFQAQPGKLSLQSRKYLCLFVTTLLERDIADFKDINVTPLEVFLCAITKPFQAFAYENRLAEALKRHGDPYLKDAVVIGNVDGNRPDYPGNRDLFDHTLSAMRKSLRANTSQRQQRQADFAKTIRAVMDQMKQDLKAIVADTTAHALYIQFVRAIVPLIKTNDLCPVDTFFYQISSEYSPSAQDPRLQTAAILSYGLRLEDEDTRAVPGLFYFLYPNFKIALANGKLAEERAILEEGMRNQHVFSFMISRMLPAIIGTTVRASEAWILLEIYVGSVERLLTAACVHREIGEGSMNDLLALLKFVIASTQQIQGFDVTDIKPEHLYALIQMTKVMNLFGPSLSAFLCMPTNSKSAIGAALAKAINSFTDFTRSATEYLSEAFDESSNNDSNPVQLNPYRLFNGIRYQHRDPSLERNEHINGFAKHMIDDIQKTWVTTGSTISVRGPARAPASSTQSGQGTAVPVWNIRHLAAELHGQVNEWNHAHDGSAETIRRRRRRAVVFGEDLLF
ncbi:Mus7/MMS22 family-domain-containing protein [Xylariales sp. AK1849]|nr:Mus7/MMS22 family-domain-containing protein [Xylariales sp. AK1849]